jgi:hypothetical protein
MGVRMTENCRFAPVSPTEKLVLLVLADCHNDETGRCFPGLAYLSTVTGLNKRSVQRAVHKLEAAGVIRVQRGAGTTSSTYRLPSRPYAHQRTDTPGGLGTPATESHHGDDSVSSPEVTVCHHSGGIKSPKPEENQNKEPENNQKRSSSERFAIRSALELSSSAFASAEGSSPPSRKGELTRAQRREHKAKGNARANASASASSTADPRFHDIVTRWHATYTEHTGEAYIFHGGRDGAALKRFLQAAANVTPETFIERARAAWTRAKADRFATKCAQAATLHGCCTCWNDIGQQLKTPTPAEASTSAARRATLPTRDERGQRPGEVPTDVSVDDIRRL